MCITFLTENYGVGIPKLQTWGTSRCNSTLNVLFTRGSKFDAACRGRKAGGVVFMGLGTRHAWDNAGCRTLKLGHPVRELFRPPTSIVHRMVGV